VLIAGAKSDSYLPASEFMPELEKPWLAKLRNFANLSAQESRELSHLVTQKRGIAARTDFLREGDLFPMPFVVLEGAACDFSMTPDGRRQIFRFWLPGDLGGLRVAFQERMERSVASVCPTMVEFIPREKFYMLAIQSPGIDAALQRISFYDEAILRRRIMALGCNAHSRVASLLCELAERFTGAGADVRNDFFLPVSQIDIADALGLTPVHVNRVLRKFHKDGYVAMKHGRIGTIDATNLSQIAGFAAARVRTAGRPPKAR
jgi:CRP-like cAMP-binding protein